MEGWQGLKWFLFIQSNSIKRRCTLQFDETLLLPLSCARRHLVRIPVPEWYAKGRQNTQFHDSVGKLARLTDNVIVHSRRDESSQQKHYEAHEQRDRRRYNSLCQ